MKNSHLRSAAIAALFLSGTLGAAPELKYVVILSRHGVRSPTWDRARLNQYSTEPWPDWGVPSGDLTAHGRELIKILGTYYREWLASEHLLTPSGCRDANRVYIRADTDQRTLETGRAFAESILPDCGGAVHSQTPGEKDPLFSGVSPPEPALAIEALRRRLGTNPQKVVADHLGEFDTLQRILTAGKSAPKTLIDPQRPVAIAMRNNTVELEGPLATASSLSEDLLLEYADGMQGEKLGWGRLTRDTLVRVLELHRIYADLMRRTPYLATIRGSNLLAHIVASMEQAASGRTVKGALGPADTALLVLAGHDTNQSNAAGILTLSWALPGYPRDETPPGGALIFCMWLNPATKRHFVRIEYLAASLDQMHNAARLTTAAPPPSIQLTIPGCKEAVGEPGCSWEEFKTVARHSIASDRLDFSSTP